MEWLTLHELSVHLDVSVRVLRQRVRDLLQQGKLVLGRDCRRDHYVDETHFVWRVEPNAFIKEAGFKTGTRFGIQAVAPVTPAATQPVAEPGSHSPDSGTKTLVNLDTPAPLAREFIDTLKVQIHAKDLQITDLTVQNRTLLDLNERLNGSVLKQAATIQLLLSGGGDDDSGTSGTRGEPSATDTSPTAQIRAA